MKKRFLSIMMALCLALSLLPATALAADDTGVECTDGEKCTHIAEIEGKHYESLQAAVNAVEPSQIDATTIRLLNQEKFSGVRVNGQNIVLDLGGRTYTVGDPTVGSVGTETNGFQLLQGSKVTMRDGTLKASNYYNLKILIQNYCDLTLEDITIDCSEGNCLYAISNNCGDTVIRGNTNIIATSGQVAFDVCDFQSYPSVSVTFDDTFVGKVDGTIEYTGTNADIHKLTIKGNGTFTGEIKAGSTSTEAAKEAINISGGQFEKTISADYIVSGAKQNENGQIVADVTEDTKATIGNVAYKSLEEAITAAETGDTVRLLNNVTEDITIAAGQEITLDLGTYTLKNASGHTITNNGTLTIIGSGTVDNVTHAKGALVNYGTATLKGGTFARSAEAGSSPSNNGGNSWYVIDNHGTMTIDGATVTSTGKYSSLIRNIKENEDEAGVLNVKSGYLSNGFITLKNDTAGTLNVTGGTIESEDQAVQNWNEATISGGELTGMVYSWSAGNGDDAEAGNLTISGDAKITGNVYAVQYKYGDIEPEKAATVKIEGGTIIGTVSTATSGYGAEEAPQTSASLTVSGGDFSKPVNEKFLTEELTAQLYSSSNPTAPYSYYESVEEAQKAAGPNDVITDLKPEGGGDPVTHYTITLNNGNTVYNTYFIKAGEPFTLPSAPSGASNQRFDGWSFHGNLYQPGAQFTINTSMTFDAMWSTVSSGGSSSSEPSYSPVMDVSKGGSVKVNPRTPEEGDEVTITVDPDSGYEVDEVTVTDRNGREVKVTAERNGTYTFTQPRGRVTISVTFVREGGSTFFSDVPESFWAYDEIAWAYDNGYVNGTSASSFSPNASISRQQVWMILARLSGADPANMSAAREWAVTNGVSDGTTPGGAVTRQQLVALLYRYATLMGYANDQRADLSAYPDAGTVAGYAVEPMQWSVANSIVGGTSNGTLDPTGTATRAQFAVMLYRFWNGL